MIGKQLVGAAVLTLSLVANGYAQYTSQTVEELKLMTDHELATEAALACAFKWIQLEGAEELVKMGALRQSKAEAEESKRNSEYFTRIGLVVRSRRGQDPSWLTALKASQSARDCQRVTIP